MSSDRYFQNACEVLDVTECTKTPSVRYIDPCNCYDKYFCLNFEVEVESCPQGTAYNGKVCDHERDVLLNYCDVSQPWLRCNVSDTRQNQLQHMCTGSSSTQSPSTTEGVTAPAKEPVGDNLGLIIGLVVAGVILVIFAIVLVVIFLKRKRAKDKLSKNRPGTVQNPEYFENGNRDDPYAIIDDSRLHNTPAPQNSYMVPNPRNNKENGTLQGSTIADTLPPNIDTVYDNSVARAEIPAGYERAGNTLKTGELDPQYFTLTKEGHYETESNNNTPKDVGNSDLDNKTSDFGTVALMSVVTDNSIDVVTDDAIIVEESDIGSDPSFPPTRSAYSEETKGIDADDDSPYRG